MANERFTSATGTPTTGRADFEYKTYLDYRYEGGAGSIYSGWTNAPIAIASAKEMQTGDLIS